MWGPPAQQWIFLAQGPLLWAPDQEGGIQPEETAPWNVTFSIEDKEHMLEKHIGRNYFDYPTVTSFQQIH